MTCILRCVPATQSQVSFHHHVCDPLHHLLPLPSGNHHADFFFNYIFIAFLFSLGYTGIQALEKYLAHIKSLSNI